jgi:hypothetical protein
MKFRTACVAALALLTLAGSAPAAASAPTASPNIVSITGQGCGPTVTTLLGRIKACVGFSTLNAGIVYGHVYFTQASSTLCRYVQFRTLGVNVNDATDWGYTPVETHLCPGPGRSMDWITNSYRVLSNRRYEVQARSVVGAGSDEPWAKSTWMYVLG